MCSCRCLLILDSPTADHCFVLIKANPSQTANATPPTVAEATVRETGVTEAYVNGAPAWLLLGGGPARLNGVNGDKGDAARCGSEAGRMRLSAERYVWYCAASAARSVRWPGDSSEPAALCMTHVACSLLGVA